MKLSSQIYSRSDLNHIPRNCVDLTKALIDVAKVTSLVYIGATTSGLTQLLYDRALANPYPTAGLLSMGAMTTLSSLKPESKVLANAAFMTQTGAGLYSLYQMALFGNEIGSVGLGVAGALAGTTYSLASTVTSVVVDQVIAHPYIATAGALGFMAYKFGSKRLLSLAKKEVL